VKSLGKWGNLLAVLFYHSHLIGDLLLVVSLVPGQARCHIEVSDFMGVLARSRHLDGASPVEVVVAQSIRQVLDLDLLQ